MSNLSNSKDDAQNLRRLLEQFVFDFLGGFLHPILIIRNHFLLLFHQVVCFLILVLDFIDHTLQQTSQD